MTKKPINRLKVARRIADQSFESEDGVEAVYYVRVGKSHGNHWGGWTVSPIILVQVNGEAIPAGVVPLAFSAAPKAGIEFPYVIIDVTPAEFTGIKKKVESGQPVKGWQSGWKIGKMFSRQKTPKKCNYCRVSSVSQGSGVRPPSTG